MVKLSPQLAQHHPDEFKHEILTGLSRRSRYGQYLWNTVVSSGVIQVNDLHINCDGWVSRSNAQKGYIHLGAQPLSSQKRDQMLFEDVTLSYEDEITLRLLHEVGHLFEAERIQSNSDQIQDLLKIARSIRDINQSLGLTAIGSLSFYSEDVKYHEDTAELISMYAFSPDYLKRYFNLLNNPDNAYALNPMGITVVPGYGDDLFNLVQNVVLENYPE